MDYLCSMHMVIVGNGYIVLCSNFESKRTCEIPVRRWRENMKLALRKNNVRCGLDLLSDCRNEWMVPPHMIITYYLICVPLTFYYFYYNKLISSHFISQQCLFT
jgi:hypothetical protein